MKTFDIERHATELEQDGYTVMHNVMPPSELEANQAGDRRDIGHRRSHWSQIRFAERKSSTCVQRPRQASTFLRDAASQPGTDRGSPPRARRGHVRTRRSDTDPDADR